MATLQDASSHQLWQSPPRSPSPLDEYRRRFGGMLESYQSLDPLTNRPRGTYAEIAVLKRILHESNRVRDKLARDSHRRQVKAAQARLLRAHDRMAELEPQAAQARQALEELEDAYSEARREAEDAREVLEAAQVRRLPEGRTRRHSSTSSFHSSRSPSRADPPRWSRGDSNR